MTVKYRVRIRTADAEVEVEAESLDEIEAAIGEVRSRSFFGGGSRTDAGSKARSRQTQETEPTGGSASTKRPDLVEIVNSIKEADEFDVVDRVVLSQRAELPRVLMCGYYALKSTRNPHLTTSDVETITNELGVRIKAQNASRSFTTKARMFFTADRVRRKGVPVRYKLNRAGELAFSRMLEAGREADDTPSEDGARNA